MARAFKFRLETLLEVRKLREDQAKRDLALARKQVLEQNQKLLGILNEEDAGKKDLRAMKQKELSLTHLRLQEGYLNFLERRIRQEYDRLQKMVKAELERRRALTEAMKGVRILEKLRDRQRRAYQYDMDRQEQKFLDEMAQRGASEES